MGFNGFGMPGHTVHYFGHWVVHDFIGRAVGYVASSWLCFLSTLLVGWLREPRGLYPTCDKSLQIQNGAWLLCLELSCHGIQHPRHEVNCVVLCVYTIGLEGFFH
jgi:hypothetical protein